MLTHICDYTINHWIVHFEWIMWYVSYIPIKLLKNGANSIFLIDCCKKLMNEHKVLKTVLGLEQALK